MVNLGLALLACKGASGGIAGIWGAAGKSQRAETDRNEGRLLDTGSWEPFCQCSWLGLPFCVFFRPEADQAPGRWRLGILMPYCWGEGSGGVSGASSLLNSH